MPLPTLTHNQTAVTSTGSLTPTDQQVLTALETNIALCTYWEKDASGDGYLIIRPKATSPVPKFRVILCGNPTAGYMAPDTTIAGIWIGILPEGGDYVYSNYQSATPYGAGPRFSGYWLSCKTLVAENVYFIENSEYIVPAYSDDSADLTWASIAGPIFVGPTAGNAEADGRIWGIITAGSVSAGISISFWSVSSTGFMGHASSSQAAHVGIFKPTVPTTFQAVSREASTVLAQISDTGLTTIGDSPKEIWRALNYAQTAVVPYYPAGRLRQMYLAKKGSNRDIITSGGSPIGYRLAKGVSPTIGETVVFGNS